MMMTQNSKSTNTYYLLVFAGICFLIIIISGIYYHEVTENQVFNGKAGEFGDLFGALNAVFSGFAFSGLIITVIMQMKELKQKHKIIHREP